MLSYIVLYSRTFSLISSAWGLDDDVDISSMFVGFVFMQEIPWGDRDFDDISKIYLRGVSSGFSLD